MNRDEENAGKSLTRPTGMSMADAIARRVSCRAYKTDPVPKAHVLQILEAARLAPSACNQQPWRFAVVRDPGLRRRIVEEGFLPGIKMTWAIAAPVHVVVGMETSFLTHRLAASVSGVDYPWVDIGIAAEHLVLAATELGLATCCIGWIKLRSIARLVGWPRSVNLYGGRHHGGLPQRGGTRGAPGVPAQTAGRNRTLVLRTSK